MHLEYFVVNFYVIKKTVPAILNQAVPATTEEVDKVIEHTMKCAYKYTC